MNKLSELYIGYLVDNLLDALYAELRDPVSFAKFIDKRIGEAQRFGAMFRA